MEKFVNLEFLQKYKKNIRNFQTMVLYLNHFIKKIIYNICKIKVSLLLDTVLYQIIFAYLLPVFTNAANLFLVPT